MVWRRCVPALRAACRRALLREAISAPLPLCDRRLPPLQAAPPPPPRPPSRRDSEIATTNLSKGGHQSSAPAAAGNGRREGGQRTGSAACGGTCVCRGRRPPAAVPPRRTERRRPPTRDWSVELVRMSAVCHRAAHLPAACGMPRPRDTPCIFPRRATPPAPALQRWLPAAARKGLAAKKFQWREGMPGAGSLAARAPAQTRAARHPPTHAAAQSISARSPMYQPGRSWAC